MSATQQFLTQQTNLNDLSDLETLRTGFVAPLANMGLLACSGPDAVSLLHRLLTNDVERMQANQARLNGLCTAQGRLLASFLTFRSENRILLQLPTEILETIQKRLQMYVLRDKVEIADASNEYALLSIGGSKAATMLTDWFPELPAEPYAVVANDAGTLIRLTDAFGSARYQWLLPPAILGTIWPSLTANLTAQSDAAWRLADIDAGIPTILTATQEQFVPQMVNLDLVGGVSFKKGCFIGQEVVARTRYLGKTPRRMLAASIEAPLGQVQAGMDVFSSSTPDQPCGKIVNAGQSNSNTVACLVSIRLDAVETGTIHLDSANGPELQFTPLPYALSTENA